MEAPKEEDWPPGYADANKGPEILIVTITLTALALLFVCGRIYSRHISLRRLAADDYIVIFCIVRRSLLLYPLLATHEETSTTAPLGPP